MQTAGENADAPPTRSGAASSAPPEPVEALLEAYIRHVCGPQEAERLTEVAAGHLAGTNGEGVLAGEDPAATVGRAAREAALGWLAVDSRRLGRRLSGGRCHTIPALLGERSEGRISARDLDRLYRHLSGCAQCAGLAARYDGAEWTLRRELSRNGTAFSVGRPAATTAPAPPQGTEQAQAGDAAAGAEQAASARAEEAASAEATQASALAEEAQAARAAQGQALADEAAAAAAAQAQALAEEAAGAEAAQAQALAEEAAAAQAAQASALAEEADLARAALATALAVTGGLAREAQAAELAVEAERGRVWQAVELDRAAALARAAQAVELADATELALRAQTAELTRAATEARASQAVD